MDGKNRFKLLIFSLVFLLVSLGLAYYKSSVQNSAFQKQFASAERLEKSGQIKEAIEAYKKALSYVSKNDTEKKRLIALKISNLKQKASETNDSSYPGDSSKQRSEGSVSPETTAVSYDRIVEIDDLGKLLPSSFLDMKSEVVASKDVASVRFDDVNSMTSYFVYVYRHETVASAQDFLETARSKIFPKNVKDVMMKGSYNRVRGFYGENESGDSALYFRYGNLVFELLLRSDTLKKEERFNHLIELQKVLRKP